jgi:protein SCO1/2
MKNLARASAAMATLCLLAAGTVSSGNAQQQGLPPQLENVGIDQKLDHQIPLDLTFTDDGGNPVALKNYFGDKPVIMVLAYYECPMLCTLVLNGLLRAMRAMNFDAGDEFNVVTVSIDHDETTELARAKKREYIGNYEREGAEKGWWFLTGEEPNIRKLADAVGFRYNYDPETDEFAHAAAIMVATSEGRLARYFYGVEYSPKDLRLGLVEASKGKIGSPVDQVLLFCFHYDPTTGKYGLVIWRVVQLAGIVTVLGLLALIFFMTVGPRLKRRLAQPQRA